MAGRKVGTPKTGGRQAGTPNKINALLKDEILEAAGKAHPGGRVAYLTAQAKENPAAFLTLLGKVLPTQLNHSNPDGTLSRPQTILLRGPDDDSDPSDTA